MHAFREFVNGPNVSKSTAISNSDNWTGAPATEDDGSLDDIPSSTDAFTAAGPGAWAIHRGLRLAAAAHTLIYLP